MPLSNKQVTNVCLEGHGSKKCKFLNFEELDQKYYCMKLTWERKNIEKNTSAYIMNCKIKKINPHDLNKPIGDNCDGFLFLRNLEQGLS